MNVLSFILMQGFKNKQYSLQAKKKVHMLARQKEFQKNLSYYIQASELGLCHYNDKTHFMCMYVYV
jgi:hypothetical protein